MPEQETEVGGIAVDRLRSIVERLERLNADVAALREDQKDILTEAASAGFDKKIIKQIINIRKMDPSDLEEQETILDLYRRALGL